MPTLLALDLDGVLTTRSSCFARTGVNWDAQYLTEDTHLQVVLDAAARTPEHEWKQAVEFYQTIDPTCVTLLNNILTEFPDIRILLTSEQRRLFRCGEEYGSEKHLQYLGLHLFFAGVEKARGAVVGVISHSGDINHRAEQISAYAQQYGHCNVVAVDDAHLLFTDDTKLVHCKQNGFDLDVYFKVHELISRADHS